MKTAPVDIQLLASELLLYVDVKDAYYDLFESVSSSVVFERSVCRAVLIF